MKCIQFRPCVSNLDREAIFLLARLLFVLSVQVANQDKKSIDAVAASTPYAWAAVCQARVEKNAHVFECCLIENRDQI